MNKWMNQLAVTLYRLPWVRDRWAKTFAAVTAETTPWTPLAKPLAQATMALVTTGGVHLKTDSPFNMADTQGDPSYRVIPATVNPTELTITHDYYDHRDAEADINLVLPLEILREYQQQGVIGAIAPSFYSFMGHIAEPHLTTLINQTAKQVGRALRQDKVDVVLLVPA